MLFPADSVRVLDLEQVRLFFLLEVVLDQTAASIRHFFESMGQSLAHRSLIRGLARRLVRIY